MLEVTFRNAHGNLSEKDREYASRKLGKLDRYFPTATRVELAHVEDKTGHKLEVTIFARGQILRGQELNHNMQAAIDKVADKMETRLRRLKTKLQKRKRHKISELLAA